MSEDWCKRIEKEISEINAKVDQLKGIFDNQANLLKFVVTPLIAVVGVLVGIKILG